MYENVKEAVCVYRNGKYGLTEGKAYKIHSITQKVLHNLDFYDYFEVKNDYGSFASYPTLQFDWDEITIRKHKIKKLNETRNTNQ
jgi:hypothetical protein